MNPNHCPVCQHDRSSTLWRSNGEENRECEKCLHTWQTVKLTKAAKAELKRKIVQLSHQLWELGELKQPGNDIIGYRVPVLGTVRDKTGDGRKDNAITWK